MSKIQFYIWNIIFHSIELYLSSIIIVLAVHHGIIHMMFDHYLSLYQLGDITLIEFMIMMIKSVHLT